MTEFELCLPCTRLRRHTPYGWQGCSCLPGPEWEDSDVSEENALCVLCVRGLAGGPSRWTSLACPPCRAWEQAVQARLGGALLALERHSIANGVAVDLNALPETQERQTLALMAQFAGWKGLYAWTEAEVHRLAAQAGWADRSAVPYAEWLQRFPTSSEVSRDAYLRLRGVDPKWVVDTFPVLPRPASQMPEDPWEPADVGQPAAGERVGISPGPDGHDVTIGAGKTGTYSAICGEPGCGWQWRSLAFPAVRWQANRHSVNSASCPRTITRRGSGRT